MSTFVDEISAIVGCLTKQMIYQLSSYELGVRVVKG